MAQLKKHLKLTLEEGLNILKNWNSEIKVRRKTTDFLTACNQLKNETCKVYGKRIIKCTHYF